jgi:hypothetical protein
MKPNKLALALPEYDRIFKVIYSILDGRKNAPHSCMFFAAAASLLLNQRHKIRARFVAGAFLLYTGTQQDEVILIGGKNGNEIISNENEFHCWVQTELHIIDFMSPIFREALIKYGTDSPIPRKMFQRLLSDEAPSIDSMQKTGDFFVIPNLELTEMLLDRVTNTSSAVDLLHACYKWYRKHPQKLPDMALCDDLGQIQQLKLTGPAIVGAW